MVPVSWTIHREVVLLLGWARAILMQFAHPLVARGVADHSGFTREGFGRWRRLHRTLGAMLTLTFGTEAEVAATIAHINGIHHRVRGRLAVPEGRFEPGHAYGANDPALLRWVHATCLDSFLLTYELFVAPLWSRPYWSPLRATTQRSSPLAASESNAQPSPPVSIIGTSVAEVNGATTAAAGPRPCSRRLRFKRLCLPTYRYLLG